MRFLIRLRNLKVGILNSFRTAQENQTTNKKEIRNIEVRETKAIGLTSCLGILVALILGVGSALISIILINVPLHESIYFNSYFNSDTSRVFEAMTSLDGSHRANVHPLFSLVAYTLTNGIQLLLGCSDVIAVKTCIALVAGCSAILLLSILRRLGLLLYDALLLTALYCFSSSSLAWFGVPETHVFSGLTVLGTIFLFQSVPNWTHLKSATILMMSSSMLITNGVLGSLACLLKGGRKLFLESLFIMVPCFVVLILVQKFIFPNSMSPVGVVTEAKYLASFSPALLYAKVEGILIGGLILPEWLHSTPTELKPTRISISTELVKRYSLTSGFFIIGWLYMLVRGTINLAKAAKSDRTSLFLLLVLTFELLLYIFYGRHTFLFAPNYLPLLIILLAYNFYAGDVAYRQVNRILIVILTIFCLLHNTYELRSINNIYHEKVIPPLPPNSNMEIDVKKSG